MAEVFFITLAVFGLAVAGMAIGVMVSGKRLKGSCGGVIAPDGRVIGDCLCAREGEKACDKAEAPAQPLEASVAGDRD